MLIKFDKDYQHYFIMTEEQQVELSKLNEERKAQNKEPLEELPEAAQVAEPDDATVFAAISKRIGKEVKSYDDLFPKTQPTPEDIEKETEARENRKMAWALQSGTVSSKKYESFNKAKANPEALVFQEFSKEQKALDSEISDADIKEKFEDIKERMGANVISQMGQAILQKEYSEVFGLDKQYQSFEESERTAVELSKKVSTGAPAYISLHTTLVDKYTKDGIEIEIPTAEGKEPIKIVYKIDDKKAKKILSALTDENKVKSAVTNGYDTQSAELILKNALVNSDLEGFAKQIYDQATEKATFDRESLFRGIPSFGGTERKPLPDTDSEKKVKENHGMVKNVYAIPEAV